MATVIRFARHGTKKKPYYRLVVQDSRSPRDGKFIEHIGGYDPDKEASTISVERERLMYWLSVGAKMSTSVQNRMRTKMREWTAATPVAAAPAKPASKKAASKEA